MIDIQAGLDYVYHWEDDPKNPGKVTTDEGGKTRLGLASKWHPELNDANFYNVPLQTALKKAFVTYQREYASPIQFNKIVDQRVGNKILDMCVSFGPTAVEFVQQCVGLVADGAVGPITLTNINSASPDALLFRLANVSLSHYRLIPNRSKEEYESWDTRGRCLGDINVFL